MPLNLSTLTSLSSTSVLEEIKSTAGFLRSVPLLKNLSTGSNAGGDAVQATALNQPLALPLDSDGKGYLYLSGLTGNFASLPNASNLNGITDFVMEAEGVHLTNWNSFNDTFLSKYKSGNYAFIFRRQGGSINFYALYNGAVTNVSFPHGLTGAATASVKITRVNTSITAEIDTGAGYVSIGTTQTVPATSIDSTTNPLEIGSRNGGMIDNLKGKIRRARIWNNGTATGSPILEVDFNAANVRHNDRKFECVTGQIVTINQNSSSSNDVASIIKKSVLRFASATSGLEGSFSSEIDNGYMFAVFSVIGTGVESGGGNARVFAITKINQSGTSSTGAIFSLQSGTNPHLRSHAGGTSIFTRQNLYSDELGQILHECKITSGEQLSRVNNADERSSSLVINLEAGEFHIGKASNNSNSNAAIDLEFLALFNPDSIPDDKTAQRIRNYINGRGDHPIFTLIDSAAYYFYDGTKSPVGAISSGSSAWSGRVVGSDNGDSASLLATQATSNDAPVGDGYVVTFAGNNDHLDIPQVTLATGDSFAWMVCGTSLGTFAYKVAVSGETELSLLGHAGGVRSVGDSYGIILLPESASAADVDSARRLLIDRGAADAASVNSIQSFWLDRHDIVEFKHVNFTNSTNLVRAWKNANLMNKFANIYAPNGTNFTSSWQNCSALTSFPAGAKLGTAAVSVNFTSAWQSSGLESFPRDIDLSNGVNFPNAWRSTALLTFPAIQSTSAGRSFFAAWYECQEMTSFGAANINASEYFALCWAFCAKLEDFPRLFTNWDPSLIVSGVFNRTWDGCSSLTAISVENILTSIAASGKFATSTGASGGTALADAAIDIDYNAASGSLSAATNSAVTSLKSKGWSIIVNNVTL